MKFEVILNELKISQNLVNFQKGVDVKDFSVNSNSIDEHTAFIAYQGESIDGHQFIEEIAKKAPLIVLEKSEFTKNISTPWILVKNARKAWSHLEALKYDHPEKKLKFFGVTGTNGKTSTVQIIRFLLQSLGIKSLCIGTLGAYLDDEFIETTHTTPDPNVLYKLLGEAVKKSISVVCMEVASHGIAQEKLSPIRFQELGFTSFSQDHLDFHKTMEHYFATKLRFFNELAEINAHFCVHDDVNVPFQAARYGRNLNIKKYDEHGAHIEFDGRSGVVPYFGKFLVENFLCALNLVENFVGKKINADVWQTLPAIPGRLEPVEKKSAGKPLVIVDYAHTPDALEKALQACRAFTKGKLSVVFGCGGDRDPLKRPLMAEIAEKFADSVVVTSDNPRTEDPQKIIDEICRGFKNKNYLVEADRKKAIEFSISKAKPDDTVLIAGKGHETYQIIGKAKHPFDDREVAREFLA